MSKQTIAATMVAQRDNQRLAAMMIFAVSIYFLLCVPSYAASAIYSVLCSVILMVIIDIGRGVATLAVIVLGISALMGRATWAQGLTILAGIAIIFGAPGIALKLGSSAVLGAGLSSLVPEGLFNIGALAGCAVGV
ncbi:MAG: TrbC/VirB2 family protein [Pseudomonadota bacterium]